MARNARKSAEEASTGLTEWIWRESAAQGQASADRMRNRLTAMVEGEKGLARRAKSEIGNLIAEAQAGSEQARAELAGKLKDIGQVGLAEGVAGAAQRAQAEAEQKAADEAAANARKAQAEERRPLTEAIGAVRWQEQAERFARQHPEALPDPAVFPRMPVPPVGPDGMRQMADERMQAALRPGVQAAGGPGQAGMMVGGNQAEVIRLLAGIKATNDRQADLQARGLAAQGQQPRNMVPQALPPARRPVVANNRPGR
jgi:hypothetical protein